MLKRVVLLLILAGCAGAATSWTQNLQQHRGRPEGPCDIYAAAKDPCVAAHSTTRALYQSYDGPLYQVLRQSDGKTLDIKVVQPGPPPGQDGGGYADAAAQDAFCANTYCWISRVYDQSPQHNDLSQAPRGGFSGPAMGGYNNLPLGDMAPVTVMGHKVYGVFIEPGMGLRIDDARKTAVDDQAEGQYWVIDGHHFNGGCCFDYGNAEIDSHDDDNGTMETAYYGDTTGWIHGNPPGPWIMTDQENNLVGCVNTDGSPLCANLPDIKWRFVTAVAKGEPHHWASLGGDAQRGSLRVMFDGQRVDPTYDPMRKQGAILLGNGGDNSNGSQGTFYEGAVTAGGTYPGDATDQLVQANVVSAAYGTQRLTLTPASTTHEVGLQTFLPGSAQDARVTFTNTSGSAVKDLRLGVKLPSQGWGAVLKGRQEAEQTFPDAVAPGATVSAIFTITAGPKPFNGDLVADASWHGGGTGARQTETAAEKVRSAAPVKINEFRISSGATGNATDAFIELYNAGTRDVDLSGWTLTERPARQAIFSAIRLASGTRLAPRGFFLLGLANSGLAVPAKAGDTTLNVRSVAGMHVGDVVTVGTGAGAEVRKIVAVGTAAGDHTNLWQPLPDGPISLSPGSTNVPVESVSGFKVGEKLALGYGAAPAYTGSGMEQYETATVTAVGKPGTQDYLAADAAAGVTNLQVTSVENITAGDRIRLDVDSLGHGIETVTVTHVGTKASQTNLAANADAGATRVSVRRPDGFAAGDRITIGTPASREIVTVQSVGSSQDSGTEITFAPPLARKHVRDEWVVSPGSGLDVAAPLRFSHAANLPFSVNGTGITFQPATRFVHLSNEPVQPLGSGLTLDRPLAKDHAIHSAVRDATVKTAGYQGTPQPNQWFGGPELTTTALTFGRMFQVREGSMVLRDAAGLVVDSLNYGGLVDPWAAEGYQASSGEREEGCFVPSPDAPADFVPAGLPAAFDRSAGRYPDGADSGSNCEDFHVEPGTTLPEGASAGSAAMHVSSVAGFHAGMRVMVGTGDDREIAAISDVGSAGATSLSREVAAGSTAMPVEEAAGFEPNQTVTIGQGAEGETVKIASIHESNGSLVMVTSPLRYAHAAGTGISGTGLALVSPLTRAHPQGAQVTVNMPTPGAPNSIEPHL